MNTKETTKHFRKRLAAAGIKARCSFYESCGYNWIKVSVPDPEIRFTEDQQKEICLIAKVNGLTRAMGEEIDINRATNPMQSTFLHP